jgi:hypothetical protein
MNFEELEEALDDLLPPGFSIETDKYGQIIILTNLRQDEDGELYTILDDEVDQNFDTLDEIDEDE